MLLLPPSQLCRLVEIVRKALSWPARQIAINAGEDGSIIVGKILEKDQYAYGFDAQNGEYVNMLAKGIIDPTKVVRSALQNAARRASDHHGSHGGRKAEEGLRDAGNARWWGHGWHGGVWTTRLSFQPKTRAREVFRAFFMRVAEESPETPERRGRSPGPVATKDLPRDTSAWG